MINQLMYDGNVESVQSKDVSIALRSCLYVCVYVCVCTYVAKIPVTVTCMYVETDVSVCAQCICMCIHACESKSYMCMHI